MNLNKALEIGRLTNAALRTKRYWVPLVIVLFIMGNIAGMLRPKKYESMAQVMIHQPPIQDFSVQENLRIKDTLDTIKERITSYSFLANVAKTLNLDAGVDPNTEEYNSLINRIRKGVTLVVKNQDLFQVIYEGATPQEARDVTEQIVRQFITETSDFYNQRIRKTTDFLESQLVYAQRDLEKAQLALTTYKQENINELPEAQNEHQSRLAARRTEMQLTQEMFVSTRESRDAAETKLASMEPEIVSETKSALNPLVTGLQTQEHQLNMQLELLLKDYKDEHWKVQDVRKQLDLVRDQLTSSTQEQLSETTTVPNPQYVSLQEKITGYNLELTSLERRISQQQQDIVTLEKYLDKIPESQRQLDILERDYTRAQDQVVKFYDQLTKAKLTSEVEAQGQGPTFNIQDPPRLPTKPSSPNMIKITVLSLMLSLGAGGGLIFLFALMDGTIRSVREARTMVQMPLLGVVQQIVTAREIRRRRRRLVGFVLGTGTALVLLIVIGVFTYTHYRESLILGVDQLRQLLGQL